MISSSSLFFSIFFKGGIGSMSSFKVNFKCKPFEFNCEVPVTMFGLPDISKFIPNKKEKEVLEDCVEAATDKKHIGLADIGGAVATTALFATSLCLSALSHKD